MHLLEGHNYLPGCNKLEVRFEDEKSKLEVWALVISVAYRNGSRLAHLQLTSDILFGSGLGQLMLWA